MLRCASIGLGWWGGEHAVALQGKSNLLRIAACHTDSGDSAGDAAQMRAFAERYDARPFARFDELLADRTVDAVIITTPHSLHVPQIIAAAEAGNNGTCGATMIPLLALGVPGDIVTAVILGAFMIHGLQPGPLLFEDNLDLIYSLFIGIMISSVFLFVVWTRYPVGVRNIVSFCSITSGLTNVPFRRKREI